MCLLEVKSMLYDRSLGFTLHGLWPNLDNPCHDDFPEYCDSTPFKPSDLDPDLYKAMKAQWLSYTVGKWLDNIACSAKEFLDYACQRVCQMKSYKDVNDSLCCLIMSCMVLTKKPSCKAESSRTKPACFGLCSSNIMLVLFYHRAFACSTDDECFWSHEWSCHGSCSGLSQEDYFSSVMKLHEEYDIKV
jgi:ribonuclease I